jgi:hypothetical protein
MNHSHYLLCIMVPATEEKALVSAHCVTMLDINTSHSRWATWKRSPSTNSYYNPVQYELIIGTIKAMLRMSEARTDGNEQ